MLIRYPLISLLVLTASAACAQESPPADLAPTFRYSYGFRAGLGLSAYSDGRDAATLRPTGALTGSYNVPFVNCWLGASGALEFRPDPSQGDVGTPYAAATFFLRTGHGPNRAHLLVGMGHNWALGDNPADTDFAEYTRHDSFVMLGFESDYTHRTRRSNALGVYFNYGLTPAIRGYRFSPGGGRTASDNARHLALTISLSPCWYR